MITLGKKADIKLSWLYEDIRLLESTYKCLLVCTVPSS